MTVHLLGTIAVHPVLPERIQRLRELAYNLWWSWTPPAVDLFTQLGGAAWEECGHNPVRMLSVMGQERLNACGDDPSFLASYDRVMALFDAYMNPSETWFSRTFPEITDQRFAYFSAEFGLHECLPIYSGGLGILSGDHCKSASDQGIPLVGVGLLYNQGYFQQLINGEGWQEAVYARLDFSQMPISRALGDDGEPIVVSVEMPDRVTHGMVWRVQVGRVPVYLLDTDIEQNSDEDRRLSSQLYGGDRDMRISQEIMLGMGGVKALNALGVKATVFHMNEGHSAFLGLERMRDLMRREGMSYNAALEAVAASSVFTTHTPVPAGHDAFSHEMMDRYFARFMASTGISRTQLFSLGAGKNDFNSFSMTVLALNTSRYANGVSKLHGEVSRELWRDMWEGFADQEMPIGHITNGIHVGSWLAPELWAALEAAAGSRWYDRQTDASAWSKAAQAVSDGEMWAVHGQLKERMVEHVRGRMRRRLRRLGRSNAVIRDVEQVLDPKALTIGFARRFATYKRATLIFKDPERLLRILSNPERPVQILFAGKAHPADDPGKDFIRQIHEFSQDPLFARHIVMVEGYDINLARHLVSGVDVWMNNPRRPLEACGTSGQKAAINGAINFSVLDGWWDEGYNGENGWTIGERREYSDLEEQDRVDSISLYETLENEIIPLFFDHGDDAVPHGWLQKMKESIQSCGPVFNTDRMLEDYTRLLYVPAFKSGESRLADNCELARRLADWKEKVRGLWHQVQLDASGPRATDVRVGEELEFSARVHLGNLSPEDVALELFVAPVRDGQLGSAHIIDMKKGRNGGGLLHYSAQFRPESNGNYAFGVRAVPRNEGLVSRREMGLVRWA
jgi:starch phosphorylase